MFGEHGAGASVSPMDMGFRRYGMPGAYPIFVTLTRQATVIIDYDILSLIFLTHLVALLASLTTRPGGRFDERAPLSAQLVAPHALDLIGPHRLEEGVIDPLV